MQYGKLRKWNFNFRGTLSAAWIRWEPIASFSLFLTEERLLWKLTRRETGWHSSNIRCINENLGFWIARCGFRILCCRSRMAGTGFSIPCPWNVDSRFQSLARFRASYIEQAPAVQKLDNAIHRINPYPVDSAIGFAHIYPLDSEFIRWIELSILWTTGSEFRISNPWTDSGSVYKKKIPGVRNSDYRTPRISTTDSILQCGSRNQDRKQDMIPWLPR